MLSFFSDLFRYLTNHLLESINTWTISVIYSWFWLYKFRNLGWCLTWGYKSKSRTYFNIYFFMPPKDPLCVRCISPIFFEVWIPNLVFGCILGWRCMAYHFRVTVTLTFDLVFRLIVIGAYLLYCERSGSVVECLTQDRGADGSSLTGVTELCPWARTLIIA